MTVVYVDILFIINFSIDYMSLYLAGRIQHLFMTKRRLIVASVLLALYSLWALLYCASYMLLVITAILAAIAAETYVYRQRGLKRNITSIFSFLFMNALIASATTLLYRLFTKFVDEIRYYNSAESKIVVFTILAAVSGITVYIGNCLLTSRTNEKVVKAKIHLDSYISEVELLVDSGNRVIDPISGRRVVFLTPSAMGRIAGEAWEDVGFLPTRRRCICVETIAGKQVLPAFIVDKICISGYEMTCLVAVQNECKVDGYDGLIPAALLGG